MRIISRGIDHSSSDLRWMTGSLDRWTDGWTNGRISDSTDARLRVPDTGRRRGRRRRRRRRRRQAIKRSKRTHKSFDTCCDILSLADDGELHDFRTSRFDRCRHIHGPLSVVFGSAQHIFINKHGWLGVYNYFVLEQCYSNCTDVYASGLNEKQNHRFVQTVFIYSVNQINNNSRYK